MEQQERHIVKVLYVFSEYLYYIMQNPYSYPEYVLHLRYVSRRSSIVGYYGIEGKGRHRRHGIDSFLFAVCV